MSTTTEQQETTKERHQALRGLPAKLGVELVLGLALAAVILLVAWASSNAIHFVYGGY
jgi:hypothetical protein